MRRVDAPPLPDGYISFEYQRGVRALIGQWRARVKTVAAPELGATWSVPGFMEGGVLTEAVEIGSTPFGEDVWEIAGHDAGFRLMQSPPLAHQIKASDLGGVLAEVAKACGLSADITLESYSGLDFRHCVNGQTAANVILDLAMLGGSIAYITPGGTLRVSPPRGTSSLPGEDMRLSEVRSSSLDLEGYASGVMVTLHRRGEGDDLPEGEEPADPGARLPWTGSTPPGTLSTVSRSGTTALPGGTLTWSYRLLEPIGAVVDYSAILYLPGIGVRRVYVSKYEYDIRTAVVRVGNQEQREWRWGLTDMEAVEDSVIDAVYYNPTTGSTGVERVEQRSETVLHRVYESDLSRIKSEWSETRTHDSGAAETSFKRPYDTRIEKAWDWGGLWGDYRGLYVTEYAYEEMDVGQADTVRTEEGSPLKQVRNGQEWFVRLPGTQVTMPVRRERTTQIDEIFDRDGRCVSRVERSTDDNGRRDMLERGLYSDIYNSEEEKRQAIAWLRSLPQRGETRVQQMPGTSSISEEVSSLSQPGRRFRVSSDPISEDDLKRYIESGTSPDGRCPFLLSSESCGVYEGMSAPSMKVEVPDDTSSWSGGGVETPKGAQPSYKSGGGETGAELPSIPCDYPGKTFASCPKYQALRHLAGNYGRSATPSPVVGLAGEGHVWFEKEVYFDEFMSEQKAREYAQRMARNILKAKKSSRGVVQTMELPLNTRIAPDGSILSVRHDFEALRTHVTHLPRDRETPEYLMLLSAGGVALNLYERESVGKARSGIGRVVDLRPDRALVALGGRPVSCTYTVPVTQGANVLVFLPPGSTSSGVIQAVMG